MAPKKSGKKRKKATPRQMKLIEERAKGKSQRQEPKARATPKPQSLQAIPRKTHASLVIKRCSNYAAAFQISWTDTA